MHHPTDRIIHTTAFVTLFVEHWLEQEIAQWIRPMKDRSDNTSHNERMLLPQSYILLPSLVKMQIKKGWHLAIQMNKAQRRVLGHRLSVLVFRCSIKELKNHSSVARRITTATIL